MTNSGPATQPTPPLRKWKTGSSDLKNNFLLQMQFLVRLNLYIRAGGVSFTKESFKAGTLACRSAWMLSKLGSTHDENQSVYGCFFTMLQNVCERPGSSSRLLSKSPAPQRCTHKHETEKKLDGPSLLPGLQ